MTASELYASLKSLYKQLMFPRNGGRQWTMAEIDQLDVRFFYELLNELEDDLEQPQEHEVYLSEVWY